MSLQGYPKSSLRPSISSPNNNFSIPAVSIPLFNPNSSQLSLNFPFHRSCVSISNKFKTNSTSDSDSNSSSTNATSFLSLLCPLLKLFSVADPSQERNYALEETTSSLSTLVRLPWGSKSLSDSFNNQESTSSLPKPLQLFEFEACPFCRRVREAMTELDL